ncbi:hypothetical protein BVX93_01630 [bacterium B13(2017)]|nr:hypothetical protein BVX93_01630 [bacterium B13(2017)]
MNKIKYILPCFALLILLLINFPIFAQLEDQEDEWKEETMSDMFEEIVDETVAKRKIKTTESPSVVTIITQQEIENSWATNIPDLLRNVAGLDIIAVYAGTHMVSIRGSNPFSSLKVGVLIDGQIVEPLLYGTNTLNQLPIPIQDIKQIVVVRSPGILYGANAFHGLVNIITKSPLKYQTKFSYTGGDLDTKKATLSTMGKVNNFGYRLSAEYVESKDYPQNKDDDEFDRLSDEHTIVNGLLNYLSNSGLNYFEATFANNDYEHWNRIPDRLCESYTIGDHRYSHFKYKRIISPENIEEGIDESSFEINLNYDFSSFEIPNNRFALAAKDIPDLHKSQTTLLFQHSLTLGTYNYIVWGAEAKKETADDKGANRFLRNDIDENVYGLFISDQIWLSEAFKLYIGGRVSDHYVTDTSFSPSISLVYANINGHVFRTSFSRIVREPNIYETNMHFALPSGNPVKIGLYLGDENADVEVNNAYEMSYSFSNPIFKFEIDAYLYDTKDLLEHRQVSNTTIDGVNIPVFQFLNQTDARITGIEIGGEYLIRDNLRIFANTSYTELKTETDFVFSPNGRFGENTVPDWKFNLGVDYAPIDKLRVSIAMNYVDDVLWERPVWDAATGTEIVDLPYADDYMLWNLNISYSPLEYAKFALKVYDLFDESHWEWPAAASSYPPRRILLNATITF